MPENIYSKMAKFWTVLCIIDCNKLHTPTPRKYRQTQMSLRPQPKVKK